MTPNYGCRVWAHESWDSSGDLCSACTSRLSTGPEKGHCPKLPKMGVTRTQNGGLHMIPGKNFLNRSNFSPKLSSGSLVAPWMSIFIFTVSVWKRIINFFCIELWAYQFHSWPSAYRWRRRWHVCEILRVAKVEDAIVAGHGHWLDRATDSPLGPADWV